MLVLSPDQKTRTQAFGILEKVPVIGELLICSGIAATTRVLGSLLTGGVAFLNAVQIARKGTITPTVSLFWQTITDRSEIRRTACGGLQSSITDCP